MPTGDSYARAMYAPENRYLKDEILKARKNLGIPAPGFENVKAAREWYAANGGRRADLIGNSPPGPVPDLRPLAEEASNLTHEALSHDAPVDESARELASRYHLPGSMLGWLREEILRDTARDATPPHGRIEYVKRFHDWQKQVRDDVMDAQSEGNDVDGVYVHAGPLHVGLQRSHEAPYEYSVVITGVDEATTEAEWIAATRFVWTALGTTVERPLGKRQSLSSIRDDFELWKLYRQKDRSYKKVADQWGNPDGQSPIEGGRVHRAVKNVERRLKPTSQPPRRDRKRWSPTKIGFSVVTGPRDYRSGGFEVIMPEIRKIEKAKVSLRKPEPHSSPRKT